MTVLVTGGAGFIGSCLSRRLAADGGEQVVVIDSLTYAGSLLNLGPNAGAPTIVFEKADIRDAARVAEILQQYRPRKIYHLAAETHVDRSIDGPATTVDTNVMGTLQLLECFARYRNNASTVEQESLRFVHVSTDEVFGSLGEVGAFTETSPYQPRSPYSASKASADHLVRAWGETYGLPVIVSNCSNNYGPFQHPEKLIPKLILSARACKPLPLYGDGSNKRDWLYVEDHAEALIQIGETGRPHETYLIGGQCELSNKEVAEAVCAELDRHFPSSAPHADLITFVTDRPGHDFRYAIDPAKIMRELDWRPRTSFAEGIAETVAWYANNEDWHQQTISDGYKDERLGLSRLSS